MKIGKYDRSYLTNRDAENMWLAPYSQPTHVSRKILLISKIQESR